MSFSFSCSFLSFPAFFNFVFASNFITSSHQGVHKNSFRNVREFQDRIGIWKCWFLMGGENRSTRRKTSRSRVESQKKKLRRNSVLHSSQVSPLTLMRRSSRNFNIPPVPFEAFKFLNNGHWGILTFEDWSALNSPFLPHGSGFEIVRSCDLKVCRSRGTKGTHVSLTRGFYKSSGKFFKSSLLQGTL